MKRALILDFGGVISRTLFETHAQTEQALGLCRGTLTWRGPFAPESDLLWQRMQSGEISEREYWLTRSREVGLLVGEDWPDMQSLVQRARGCASVKQSDIIRPETLELIERAHQAGIELAILSNELDLFYGQSLREKLDCLKYFKVLIDATYTGILKPDPRAYQLALDALNLPANDCVFVDDQARNIEGALKLGIACVQFDVTQPQASCQTAYELLFSEGEFKQDLKLSKTDKLST